MVRRFINKHSRYHENKISYEQNDYHWRYTRLLRRTDKVHTDHWKKEQAKWQIPVLQAKDWNNIDIGNIKKHIEKLRYIEAPAVQSFLNNLQNRITVLENSFSAIKNRLDLLVVQLAEQYGEHFNAAVGQLPYKTFLFKSRSNNLKLEDLQRSLDTPFKIVALMQQLDIEHDLPDMDAMSYSWK